MVELQSVSYIPLQAIVEFKIAHGVPRQGSISYRDLACEVRRLAGVDVSSADLRRLLRLAMVNNIFDEPETGLVTHNRTSLLLLEDETLASWVGMFTTDLLPSVAYTVAAMKRWPGSQEPNQTVRKMRKMLELLLTARKGVNIAFNHDLAFFDHLQADEDRAIRYDMSMRVQSSREGFDPSHTVQSYPWAKLGKITVVDVSEARDIMLIHTLTDRQVGGNEGFVSVALAEAFPSLNFIVQDLPGMRLPANMGAVPPHLSDRVTLTTHDFFEPQPVVAGAYLFRHIFHAFSDKYAVQILRALVPALRPGARIIINDSVPPAPGSVSRVEEKSLRTMDVLMQTVCNSRERDVDEWRRLFELADARYRWQGAWKSSGLLWIVEVTWEG